MNPLNRTLLCTALLTATASCSSGDATSLKGEQAPKLAESGDAKAEKKATKPKNVADRMTAKGAKSRTSGAFLDGAALKWTEILRATPEAVNVALGDPTREGGGRISCVRFLPKRVHFACTHAARDYAHPTFGKVTVDFEDGRAAAVSLVGFPQSEGEFSVDAAIKAAGIKAARPPRPQPTDGAEVYVWFNHEAQLLIGKDQFLMRLSTVDRDWEKTKLEVIFNGPLSEEESARKKAHPTAAREQDDRPPEMKLK